MSEPMPNDTPQQPPAAADVVANERLELFRKRHREYVAKCGRQFADRPFRIRSQPGFVYDPVRDSVSAFT